VEVCNSIAEPGRDAVRVETVITNFNMCTDQFEQFERDINDEEKIITILKKTWAKMSEEGRKLALDMELSDRSKALIGKALAS